MTNRHPVALTITLAALSLVFVQPAAATHPQLIAAATTVPSAPAHYMAGDITIEQPWSPATPSGALTAAAYMTITNRGSTADRLLGGTSPAGRLEIHQMSAANGVMSMRALPDGLAIPAGTTIVLSPQGNYHLMLANLKGPLVEGAHVPAVLNFGKAGAVRIELSVAPLGARAASPMRMERH